MAIPEEELGVTGRVSGAALVVAALLAGGCGGGSKKPAASATSSSVIATTTTVSPPATTATQAADQAHAAALVLQQSDLPAGWSATPHQKTPTEDTDSQQLAACVGAPDPATAYTTNLDGPDLDMGDAAVSSSVDFVRTPALAQADLAALRGAKFAPCVKTFATASLQREIQTSAGTTLEGVTLDPLAVASIGDASLAIRLIGSLRVQAQTVAVYVDLVFVLKGRAEVTASFTRSAQPFDAVLERSLVAKLGDKLRTV